MSGSGLRSHASVTEAACAAPVQRIDSKALKVPSGSNRTTRINWQAVYRRACAQIVYFVDRGVGYDHKLYTLASGIHNSVNERGAGGTVLSCAPSDQAGLC